MQIISHVTLTYIYIYIYIHSHIFAGVAGQGQGISEAHHDAYCDIYCALFLVLTGSLFPILSNLYRAHAVTISNALFFESLKFHPKHPKAEAHLKLLAEMDQQDEASKPVIQEMEQELDKAKISHDACAARQQKFQIIPRLPAFGMLWGQLRQWKLKKFRNCRRGAITN